MAEFSSRMKAVLSVACFFFFLYGGQVLFAQGETFSTDRLEEFYDVFLCEEKNATSQVDVTPPCTDASVNPIPPPPPDSCGALLAKPTIPPLAAPSPDLEHIPYVLVNNTGLPDTDVYFVIYGQIVSSTCVNGMNSYVSFGAQPGPFTATGTTGGAAIPTAMNMPTSETFSYAFSDIPLTNGQRIIYVPYLSSGIMLFSIDNPLTGLTTAANTIAIPVASDPTDLNYPTVYGGCEFTFIPPNCPAANPGNQITFDFTCVDYYGLSIYFNLFTQNPAPSLPQNRPSGIYQSRSHTLCELQNTLATAYPAALSQWTGLVRTMGGKTLRVVSPGYAMSHANYSFDNNYFNNAALGFNWADDVWTGSTPYYTSTPLTIVTNDGTRFNGYTQGGNFVFTAATTEQFSIPWVNAAAPAFSTSTAIFNVQTFFPNMTYSLNGSAPCVLGMVGCNPPAAAVTRATEITQYLSASIAVGLIPGKVGKLTSAAFPPILINSYNTPNNNLAPPGPTTGPWYDLYSVGLVGNAAVTGNVVYTFAYDDYLYQQSPTSSQVAPSQFLIDNTTYITIFLGPYTDN